jgi:hypothetical protein
MKKDERRCILLSMEANACNPYTWESKVGRWRVLCQPGLHIETLSQKQKNLFANIYNSGEFILKI